MITMTYNREFNMLTFDIQRKCEQTVAPQGKVEPKGISKSKLETCTNNIIVKEQYSSVTVADVEGLALPAIIEEDHNSNKVEQTDSPQS